jgi:hypothetical protein
LIFSGRHYAALVHAYSEAFEPIPDETLERAARRGNAPALLDAMAEAIRTGRPIHDWTLFRDASRAFGGQDVAAST